MATWKPAWLEALGTQMFFASCTAHEKEKKNEKNICCLDCCTSICPRCVPSHGRHRLVQVRRYVYHDVVRVQDLEKLIDCSNVQSYTINNSKVVFLKKRPQSRQFKGSGNICTSCDRSLQDPYIHCSLGCKVDFVLRQKKDLSAYLRTCDSLQLDRPPEPVDVRHRAGDDESNDTTRSTVVDGDKPAGSSGSENLSCVLVGAAAASARRKRSAMYVCGRSTRRIICSEDAATNLNRRKGIPQRSPLC